MFGRSFMIIAVVFLTLASLNVFAAEKAASTDKDAILQELNGLLDKSPDILRSVVFSMADEYQRANKVDEAIALYEKALKIAPDNEDFLNRIAGLYNQKSNYAKSVEIYKKLTELKPENTGYSNMLSDAYKNSGDKEKAGLVWENLMKSSKAPEIFVSAANFYSNENNMDKAVEAIKKAIELDPKNSGYPQVLESFYLKAEKYSDAEAICNKMLTDSKDKWMKDWANSELINIYQRQNKPQDLAARFEKELAQSPKDLALYRRLADLYDRTSAPDKAVEVYEKAVSAGVNDRDIDMRLLDLCERLNKFDKAEAQLKKLISLSPQEVYLNERLANLLNRAGKIEDAKKVWQEYIAKAPVDASVYSRFGDRLNEWGDTDAAIAQYKKAQSLDNNLWHLMRVADLLVGKERFDEAKRELNNIIKNAADNMMKQEAERKLKDIDARSAAASANKVVVPATAVAPAVVAPATQPQAVKETAKPKAEEPAKKKGKR